MESAERHVGLAQRDVKKRLRILDHAFVLAVLYDADNLNEWTGRTLDAETFSERILVGPEFLGHGLIDDRNACGFFVVGTRERAAVVHGNLQSIKISRRNHVVLHAGRLLARFDGMPFDIYGIEGAHDPHGNGEGLADGDDAGQGAEPRFQFAIKGAALDFLITDLLNVEREIENVCRRESEINIFRFAEAADKEPSNNQQHQRTCHMRDDQRAANDSRAAATGSAAGAIVQHGTAGAERRENSDNYAGDEGRAKRKEIDPRIGQELQLNGQVRAEGNGTQKTHGPVREKHAAARAEKSEQQTLRQVLANQANASSAKRGANSHFALARRGANQQNIGDVEASH